MNKEKVAADKKHRSKYADKIKNRKRLARKYGLDDTLPYPILWVLLDNLGVNINN